MKHRPPTFAAVRRAALMFSATLAAACALVSETRAATLGAHPPTAGRRAAKTLAAAAPAPLQVEAADAADGKWVPQGRAALNRFWGFPWYDKTGDGVRRIDVRAAPPPASPSRITFDWIKPLLQVLGWTVIALVFLWLLWLFWPFLRQWMGFSAGERRAPSEDRATIDPTRFEALPFPVHEGSGDLRAAARRAAEQGDFGRAVVLLFSFELLQLDGHQRIHLAKGKTNRQYLRELAGGPLAGLLEPTMIAFEDVFFGRRQLPQQRFEACWSQLDDILRWAAVPQG